MQASLTCLRRASPPVARAPVARGGWCSGADGASTHAPGGSEGRGEPDCIICRLGILEQVGLHMYR